MNQTELPREVRKALIGAGQLVNQARLRLVTHQEITTIKEIVKDLKDTQEAIENYLSLQRTTEERLAQDEGIKSDEQFGQDGAIVMEQPNEG